MKTFFSLLPWFLAFVMGLLLLKGYNFITPQYERAMQPANVQAMEDLAGKYFEWTYVDTDKSQNKFNVRIMSKRLYMICSDGNLEGTKVSSKPQFTKIGELLYFLTWTTKIGGEESMVLDCKSNKVYAHINSAGRFWGMSGEITCNGFEDKNCKPVFREIFKKYR